MSAIVADYMAARHQEREQMLEGDILCQETTSFLGGAISFSSSFSSRQKSATAESGFIYLFVLVFVAASATYGAG